MSFAGEERQAQLQNLVAAVAQNSAGLDDVDYTTPLMDADMDSLSAVEFRNMLQTDVGDLKLPSTPGFDYPSIEAISAFLEKSLA
jgi:hypothetical protein